MTSRVGSATVAERGAPALALLESKLRPPQLATGSVPRTKLCDRLEDSRATPVVIVSAAPGYGKTTLLTQWAARSSRPFAWVTVDDRDNDPVVLLSYIATAVDRVCPLDPGVFDVLSSDASIESKVVPHLGSALAGAQAPFVLALDDLQALTNRQCRDALEALFDHIPRGSQLALSGRDEPSGRVATLRARGQALEIGPEDLRMADDDAGDLLRAAEMQVSEAELAAIVERTEGWPAGLYLAALAARTGAAKAGTTGFRGDDRFVADYLRTELLSRLPHDELRFLTRTSVLDRMCGPLCDAVLESEGSAATLESLQRSNRFVVALDRNRDWYRYHHLFSELLRAELRRTEPELVPELLTRAAEWCEANAEPEAAIAYAQGAEDVDRVAGLVLMQARVEYERGRAVTVDRWMEWLERNGGLERNPMVAALGAWVSAIRGHPSEAERWADVAERATLGGGAASGDAFVQAWLATLRAAGCRHGPGQMQADAQLATEGFGRADPFWPTAVLLLGVAHRLDGDDDRADDLFDDATESARDTEGWNAVTLGLALRALLAGDRDHWPQAEALTDEAVAIVRRARMEDYPPNAIVYAASARVAIHRGERARADEQLARAQRLRPRLTHAMGAFSIQTRLELAGAYVSIADAAGARTVLREAEALMRRGSDFGTLAARAEDLRAKLESVTAETPGASTLTTAELRLLPLLTTHLTFREIGERLYLSRHTIKSHAMSIYRKLDVTSRSSAVERARELGLL